MPNITRRLRNMFPKMDFMKKKHEDCANFNNGTCRVFHFTNLDPNGSACPHFKAENKKTETQTIQAEDRARFLMSFARKEWHDPDLVLKSIGIEKGMAIADLGSGPGFFTIPLAQATGENGIVYAVDSDPTMLERLKDNIAKSGVNRSVIKFVRGDVCNTGLPSNSVDVAFFANVLHEVENKRAFLQEVKRLCKPTSYVVDVDWKKVPTERGPPLKIRLSEEEATSLLSDNGFAVTKQLDAGPKHYELICRLAAHQ